MTQQSLIDKPADGMSERVEREVGLTPTPVVRQGMEWVARTLMAIPKRILDPSAGTGVFGKVCRELWPDAYIVGFEPRGDAAAMSERHYDRMFSREFDFRIARDAIRGEEYELAATNPPFSMAYEWLGYLLAVSQLVVFLHKSQLTTDSDKVDAMATRFLPCAEARIAGRLGMFGPGKNPRTGQKWGTDSVTYSWWAFDFDALIDEHIEEGVDRTTWPCTRLPLLPPKDRRWVVTPGTEDE